MFSYLKDTKIVSMPCELVLHSHISMCDMWYKPNAMFSVGEEFINDSFYMIFMTVMFLY